jgi:hypothetical protein
MRWPAISRRPVTTDGVDSVAPNLSAWVMARAVRSPPEMPAGKPR